MTVTYTRSDMRGFSRISVYTELQEMSISNVAQKSLGDDFIEGWPSKNYIVVLVLNFINYKYIIGCMLCH